MSAKQHGEKASALLDESLDNAAWELRDVPADQRFVALFNKYTRAPYTPLASATLAAAAVDRLLSIREELRRG